MTIHTFNHSYAGFQASDCQSSSCNYYRLPARRAGKLFINGTGNRHFQSIDVKRCRAVLQQASEICGDQEAIVVDLRGHSFARTFIHKRDDPNSNSNEVSL
jgi:hypothetical protein